MYRRAYQKTTGFFVEFRLHGYAKGYAKWVKARVRDKEVSHITLFGPARTNDIRRVIYELEKVCHKYTLIPFTIGGFSRFDNITSKVIYLDINPSPQLEQFRWELAQNLLMISRTDSPWDDKRQYKFHSTVKIFTSISDNKFDKLCDYIGNQCRLTDYEHYKSRYKLSIIDKLMNFINKHFGAPDAENHNIRQHLLRITILGKGRRIMYEYDLVLNKLLNRKEALSRYWWRKTINRFRELQGQSQY